MNDLSSGSIEGGRRVTATEQKSGSDTAPDGRYCSAASSSALDEVPPAISSEIAGVNGNQFKASTAKQVINPPAKELYLPLSLFILGRATE